MLNQQRARGSQGGKARRAGSRVGWLRTHRHSSVHQAADLGGMGLGKRAPEHCKERRGGMSDGNIGCCHCVQALNSSREAGEAPPALGRLTMRVGGKGPTCEVLAEGEDGPAIHSSAARHHAVACERKPRMH
jgi:hypothetical protein